MTTAAGGSNVVEHTFYCEVEMVKQAPTEVRVQCGWADGRPRSVFVGDEHVPVIRIDQVRDELAAYPADRGPRRIFDVRTPGARLRLSFERRRRRWVLEGREAA
ncbi:MAG: hypothetical protein M3N29_06920 [Chloroflexota bacterium]|nr:hypothetical protein [Chloroflexota bacterium]